MKTIKLLWVWMIIASLSACSISNDKEKALYTQQDTLNLNGHKFLNKEFNEIIDNFPKLY